MITKIKLQDITTDKLYDGYLWWSNQDKPDIYNDQELLSQSDKPIWPAASTNPFIIEGNLWNNKEKISYLIRFIDGEYLVYQFELNNIPNDQITELSYIPNRMPDIKKLKFKEVWLPQADPLCADFEVLKPAFIAFVGFKQ